MGIEPILKESQSRVLTITLRPHLKILAEDIGFEPMRRFLNDSLANCSRNRLGNLPLIDFTLPLIAKLLCGFFMHTTTITFH